MIRALRDWSRGYSDEDVRSFQIRMQGLAKWAIGETMWLTVKETRVLAAGHIIGVWRISTLSVINGRALVSLRPAANAGA